MKIKKYTKYKYYKVTPEIKIEMEILREKGLSYEKIGKRFNICKSTVYYYLFPGERKKIIERALKFNKKLTKGEMKENNRKYQNSRYIMDRYYHDEEFREKYKKRNREFQRKKRINLFRGAK